MALNLNLTVGDKTIRFEFEDVEQLNHFEAEKELCKTVKFLQDIDNGDLNISNLRNRFIYKEAVDYVLCYEQSDKELTKPSTYNYDHDAFCDMIYDNFKNEWSRNNLFLLNNKDICYYWCKEYCKQFERQIKSYQKVYDFTTTHGRNIHNSKERPYCSSNVIETFDYVVSTNEHHRYDIDDNPHTEIIVDRCLKEIKDQIYA